MVLHVYTPLAVRRNIGPVRIERVVLVGVKSKVSGSDVVIETVFYIFPGGVSERIQLFGMGVKVETEGLVVHQRQVQRKMLRIVRVVSDFTYLAGQFRHIEYLRLTAARRVHYIIIGSLGRAPGIPELVRVAEPVGADAGGIDHLLQFGTGEARGKLIIRPGRAIVLRRKD